MKFAMSGLACLLALAASPALANATINVKLWDKTGMDPGSDMKMGIGMHADMRKAMMGIDVDRTSVGSGMVTFHVRNNSKDAVHEMIVVPISSTDAALPYVGNESRIDEDAAGHLGEVSELDPGKTGTLTLDLKPGLYAVLCNVPGHFMGGMWKAIVVK